MSHAAGARRIGVDERIVRDLRAGARPLRMDQLAALGPALELEVLRARVAELEQARRPAGLPATTHALRVTSASGEFARVTEEALRDGRVDPEERVQLRRCVDNVLREAERAAVDLEAAG